MKRIFLGLLLITSAAIVPGQSQPASNADTTVSDKSLPIDRTAKGPVPLNKEATILLDAQAKKLIINSEIALREGMLEMLLCKRQTKEHESVLAFDGKAYILHAGLVALGLDPGSPVEFDPEYKEPRGPKLNIKLFWNDKGGKEHTADAREWVRYAIHRFFGEPLPALPPGLTIPGNSELRYDDVNKELSWYGPMTAAQRDRLLKLSEDTKYRAAIQSLFQRTQPRQMEADWVFAGSAFVTDMTEGRRVYLAESGDVICVANFPSAMIDIAMRSTSQGQESLVFEAWTERIPAVGTPVRIEITEVTKKPVEKKPGTPSTTK